LAAGRKIKDMSMNHINPKNSYEHKEQPKDDRLFMLGVAFLLIPVVYFAARLVWQVFSLFFS
jgi:hypothetical protein